MKRSLLISLILHVAILCVIFFLKPEDKGKEKRPLIAEIITQERSVPLPTPKDRQKPTPPDRRINVPRTAEPPKRLDELPARQSQRKTPRAGRDKQAARQSSSPPERPSTHDRQAPFSPSREYAVPRAQPQESGRSRIFDRDIIAKATRDRDESKKDSAITFNTKEYKYYGYMQLLRQKIENVWKYPAEAGAKGIYGDLYIRFTITKNGKLGAVDLVRTSGNRDLDNAALKALRDAEPFWELPEEWGREGLTITGHFVYTLQGYYVR